MIESGKLFGHSKTQSAGAGEYTDYFSAEG